MADGKSAMREKALKNTIRVASVSSILQTLNDLVIMNAWLTKRLAHLPTFASGNSKTQID